MARVYLGIGSNHRPEEHLAATLDSLLLEFKDLAISPVFESEAVGADAPPYLNVVCGIDTDLNPTELQGWCKALESKMGRARGNSQGTVTIDIDLLTYGKLTGRAHGMQWPRPEVAEAAYVLWPLAVLAPKEKHPQLQRTYKELWQDCAADRTKIRPVDFVWHERQISSAALS